MEGSREIPIWFFIGVLLSIYGVMIFGYGLWEIITGNVAPVVLARLHAPIWWGALMLVLGLFYLVKFRPGRGA